MLLTRVSGFFAWRQWMLSLLNFLCQTKEWYLTESSLLFPFVVQGQYIEFKILLLAQAVCSSPSLSRDNTSSSRSYSCTSSLLFPFVGPGTIHRVQDPTLGTSSLLFPSLSRTIHRVQDPTLGTKQFALPLRCPGTIHRVQDPTLGTAVPILAKKFSSLEWLHYVALCRVTALSGLVTVLLSTN